MEEVINAVYRTDSDRDLPFYYVKPITGGDVRSIRIVHDEDIIPQHKLIITGSGLPINS